MKHLISQREARRLQRRVAELERRIRTEHATYGRDYADGAVNIESVTLTELEAAKVRTRRFAAIRSSGASATAASIAS